MFLLLSLSLSLSLPLLVAFLAVTPAALAGVDRIWTEADRTAALTALTGAGLPWTEDRLVSLSDQLDPDLPVPQAVWENGT